MNEPDAIVRRHEDGHLYIKVTRWEHLGFTEGAEVDVSMTMSTGTLIMKSRETEDHDILIRRAIRGG